MTSTYSLKETDISKQIRHLIYQVGGYPIQTHGRVYKSKNGYTYVEKPPFAGVSDFVVCLDGKFIAIEVKRPGQKMTEKQELFQHKVRAAAGKAFVAYSVDDVVRELGLDVKLYPMFARRGR